MSKQASEPAAKGIDAIREKTAQMAAAVGVEPPERGRSLPLVPLGQPVGSLCRAVSQVLTSAPIFRRGEAFVTVNAETGEEQPLSIDRFRSWHHGFFLFEVGEGEKRRIVETLPRDKAAVILASDELRASVREVHAVNTVRVPTWREDGTGRRVIDLLPEGYDVESKTFTVDLLPFPQTWSLRDALGWLEATFGTFPFYESGDLLQKRSYSAHVAAMLGVYAVNLLPPASVRPMIIYNGNMPGVGKSLLCRMALAPIHGITEEDCKPKNDEELRNVLDAVALAGRPYLVLDDAANLRSHDLNRFVTSPAHVPRVKGLSRRVKCANVTQVFATGNALNVTEDLARRAVLVDLHEARIAAERDVKNPHTNQSVFGDEYRKYACAALWAILRHWQASGAVIDREARKASFEAYAGLVGSVLKAAGLVNPFGARECQSGGDEAGNALGDCLRSLVGAMDRDGSLSPAEVLEALEGAGTLDTVISWECRDSKKALGHRLKKLRGRIFQDSRGREFEFGHRGSNTGAQYPIRFVFAKADR